MQKGEVCMLLCKPDYAYGPVGNPDKIPPNAPVVFEVGVETLVLPICACVNSPSHQGT